MRSSMLENFKALLLMLAILATACVKSSAQDNVCSGNQQLTVSPSDSPKSLISHTGFTSGTNYANSINCSWNLTAPESYRIEVWFEFSEIESCCDFVHFLDVIMTKLAMVSDSCTNCSVLPRFSPSLNGPQNIMTVRFTTDGSIVKKGFRIWYRATQDVRVNETVCSGNQQLPVSPTAPGSLISQAGVDSGTKYTNNMNCNWTLVAPKQCRIKAWIEFMDLETCCDKAYFSDSNTASAPLLASSSLSDFTPPNGAAKNVLTVRFTTDGSIVRRGFRIRYHAVLDRGYSGGVCNSSQQVAVSPFDPPRSLVSHPGFESGRYYSINMTCSWILTVPESFFIEVWFEFLELETQLDKVQLLDANSVLMAELSDYYPNCSVLPVFSTSRNSSGTRMSIIFSTDGSVLMRGFRIRYRAVSSDRNTFRRLFAPQPAASAVGVLSARSDIECAVLCTAVGAACRAIEFDAVRGSCRLLDGPTAGGLARPEA